MVSLLRPVIIVTLALTVVLIAATYVAAPYLISRILPIYLQTLGAEHSEFVAGRPGFRQWTINRLTLTVDGVQVDAHEVIVRYHFAELLNQRLDELKIQQLSITLPASSTESSSDPLVSPWAVIPVESFSVDDFELSTQTPVANLAGRIAMSPSVADASLRIASDLLPAALDIDLQLQPSGELTLQIAPLGSQPALSIHGQYDGVGQIKFNGELNLEGAAFELALQLAGINQPVGYVKGTFDGAGTWPLQPTGPFTGTGIFDLDFKGNAVSDGAGNGATIGGLSYKGPVDVFVEPKQWRAEAVDARVGIESLEVPDGQYLFKDTTIGLAYRAQIPLMDGAPDLSLVTGEAELSLSINLPGASRASDALALHGITLNGNVATSLTLDQQRLSGQLTVAAQHIDYEHTRFKPEGEPVKLALDLKGSRDAIADPLTSISGTLDASIVTAITSSADAAPFRQLGLDVGVQIAFEKDRYRASFVPNSLVSVLAGEQDVGFETLNTIVVDVGHEGLISSPGGSLSPRFSLAIGDDQILKYTSARLSFDAFEMNGDDIEVRGRFRSDSSSNALPIEFLVKAERASAAGTFEISTNHVIKRQVFKKELPGWDANYELLGGQLNFALSGDFDVSGQPRFDAMGEVLLEKGVARSDDIPLTGVGARLPVRLDNNDLVMGPGPVRIGSVDIGFPASEITFQLESDTVLARITDLSAKLLMAEINIDQLVYDIDNESAQFPVQVTGLPVASVLALEGDDVQGDGILDGRLPVVLNKAGARVTGGSFKARPPGGYLRYRGDLPTTNPGLDLAIRALRNFQYTDMNIGVDYAPDGALAALIRLRGKSPDVEKGRPIHFNLNISENIPALLESIRASEAAQKRIQQRLSR